jgi:two-component system response regulator RegX3
MEALAASAPAFPPERRERILLVEDEALLADSIRHTLESVGFAVMTAPDGQEGLERFRAEPPSLVLLDLMLPSLSGLDVCRTIRAESDVPIIIVTAKDSEADKVSALELGADDYMTKPFSLRELVSRVRANLRRSSNAFPATDTMSPVLTGGPIRIDIDRHEGWVAGEPVEFPPKEYDLLIAFLSRREFLLTRDFLIDEVWGPSYYGDTKTLDVHVKRLRAKVEDDPAHPERIVTVRGVGYRYERV